MCPGLMQSRACVGELRHTVSVKNTDNIASLILYHGWFYMSVRGADVNHDSTRLT